MLLFLKPSGLFPAISPSTKYIYQKGFQNISLPFIPFPSASPFSEKVAEAKVLAVLIHP